MLILVILLYMPQIDRNTYNYMLKHLLIIDAPSFSSPLLSLSELLFDPKGD